MVNCEDCKHHKTTSFDCWPWEGDTVVGCKLKGTLVEYEWYYHECKDFEKEEAYETTSGCRSK